MRWFRRHRGSQVEDGPRCDHADAVEVTSQGALVSGLCPTCGLQLTPEWFTCEHDTARAITVDKNVIRWIDIGYSLRMAHHRCPTCQGDWWAPTTIADWVAWI